MQILSFNFILENTNELKRAKILYTKASLSHLNLFIKKVRNDYTFANKVMYNKTMYNKICVFRGR